MSKESARRRLIGLLQSAYSGELAAALAYRGHWRSVQAIAERDRIRQIEWDEWHHRALVGGMLRRLEAHPVLARELRAELIGNALGALCHWAGWFLPMYAAGRLESRNFVEYETAARYAAESGLGEMVQCLLAMADAERDHEAYFRSQAAGHRLARLFPLGGVDWRRRAT